MLERGIGLRNYSELGVPLDALVSADLLVSLFLPYSPLHDGAVFIRGNRVAAAGCFLPLSRNTQLGRAMGTRHRAALGLAEETDAVVLVVSEETGASRWRWAGTWRHRSIARRSDAASWSCSSLAEPCRRAERVNAWVPGPRMAPEMNVLTAPLGAEAPGARLLAWRCGSS